MSQQLWNMHNYSKPPQSHPVQSPVYQIPNGEIVYTAAAERPTNFIQNGSFINPLQAVVSQRPSCLYAENQLIRDRIEMTRWRQSASIEDWKAYLYSPAPGPVIQQSSHVVHRQMTPYSYNVQTSGNNPNLRRYIPDHSQVNHSLYQQILNGGYKNVTNESRHRGMADNRRALTGRQANSRLNGLYQNRTEKRGREKSQYSNFSPDLIRYVDPSQLERESSDFAYIEILMCNHNEDGYVTLDDKAMSILVNAIDKVLPKNLNLQKLAESIFN